MAYEPRDNNGVLFWNERKTKDNQPDLRGDVMVDGVKYEVAGWRKPARNGSEFISLSFKRTDGRQPPPQRHEPPKPQLPKQPDFDDEIPFD